MVVVVCVHAQLSMASIGPFSVYIHTLGLHSVPVPREFEAVHTVLT